MAVARSWDYLEYELIGTNSCHIFGFPGKPELDTNPLKLRGGTLHVGDLVKAMKGRKKSAGFFHLDMRDGHALRFEGTYTNLQGTIVCFSQVSNGKEKALTSDRWKTAYFGYFLLQEEGDLFFTTQAVSGRLVETDIIVKERQLCEVCP